MFCYKCGAKIDDASLFCNRCGTRVPVIAVAPAAVAAAPAPAPVVVAAPAAVPVQQQPLVAAAPVQQQPPVAASPVQQQLPVVASPVQQQPPVAAASPVQQQQPVAAVPTARQPPIVAAPPTQAVRPPNATTDKMGPLDFCWMFLSRSFCFTGRSRRSEFWWPSLFSFLICMVLGLLGQDRDYGQSIGVIEYLFQLALVIPFLTCTIRREHDIGRSGWRLLILLIPIVGAIMLIVDLAHNGQPATNAYGPDPKLPSGSQPPFVCKPMSGLRVLGYIILCVLVLIFWVLATYLHAVFLESEAARLQNGVASAETGEAADSASE